MELKQIFSTYSKEENVDLGQFKYCPFCGTCLVFKEKGGKQRPACPDCEFVQFRNPAPGVVVVIEKDEHVLLGKRKGGFWEREMGSSPGVCG
jgi:NADH pyrophosphatase NudC (nudix superfamily)